MLKRVQVTGVGDRGLCVCCMESPRMENRTILGIGDLGSMKIRASYLLKDTLKIARLALVDVTNTEFLTEDATNADEWGPTTKQMAEVSKVLVNSEDYLRVVQVLHKRFALSTQKYWRQIHKSLILLEYLLGHGPDHLVMEFREDKDRLEELTRFAYVDWKGADRGSALQRRAKHVLHLLMDEAAFMEHRTQAKKISRGIAGFGSGSQQLKCASPEYDPHTVCPPSKLVSHLKHRRSAEESTTLLVNEECRHSTCPPDALKNLKYSDSFREWEVDYLSSSTIEESWDTSLRLRGESPSGNDYFTTSFRSDGHTNEDSSAPAPSLCMTVHSQDKGKSVAGRNLTINVPVSLNHRPVAPIFEDRRLESSCPELQKLPPPPPTTQYRYITPRPVQTSPHTPSPQSMRAEFKQDTTPNLIEL